MINNKIYAAKAMGIILLAQRNYGENAADFIEQNALELYHLKNYQKH